MQKNLITPKWQSPPFSLLKQKNGKASDNFPPSRLKDGMIFFLNLKCDLLNYSWIVIFLFLFLFTNTNTYTFFSLYILLLFFFTSAWQNNRGYIFKEIETRNWKAVTRTWNWDVSGKNHHGPFVARPPSLSWGLLY